MSSRRLGSLLPAEQIILLSIFFTIGIGALLLSLPMCQTEPMAFIDLLFTATSATCVVGLFTISLNSFTLLGQAVILALIQIGGLGLITLTLFFLSMITNLGLGTQLMAGQILDIDTWPQLKRVLYLIILVTVGCEFVGTLLIFSVVSTGYPVGHAWFIALFHSISSFCSAGITIFNCCLNEFKDSWVLLYTTILLMYIGELGFITWQEIGRYLKASYYQRPYRFTLHSKIILYGSTLLLILSTILILIIEHKNLFAGMPFFESFNHALFYAVSFKSTGFILAPLASFQLATILLIMIISFIGSSPGSTGSGVKITTFALFLATVKAAITGNNSVTIQGRKIALTQVYRAVGIVAASIGWIIATTFCLLITEQGFTFLEVFFEATSAFTSLGMQTGITTQFSSWGKFFIITSMIIGRVGSFSLILALKLRRKSEPEFSYPEERVMLG